MSYDPLARLGPPVRPKPVVRVGPKLMDGLRAIEAWQATHEHMADEHLRRMGYPDKVADDILERLHLKGLVESGVSTRTGWLTEAGRETLDSASPTEPPK